MPSLPSSRVTDVSFRRVLRVATLATAAVGLLGCQRPAVPPATSSTLSEPPGLQPSPSASGHDAAERALAPSDHPREASGPPTSAAPIATVQSNPAPALTPPSLPATEAPQIQRSPPAEPTAIRLAPGVLVDRAAGRIELEGEVCVDAGWLEQIACTPGTREHESLVSLPVRPRDVHAALLLLGLKPGAPGSWRVEEDRLIEIAPHGPALRVRVRWTSPDGVSHEEPIATWIRDAPSGTSPSIDRWLFSGSLMVPTRDGGERYLADASGSIIGLVTFGDEVLALPVVRPDAEAVAPPEWEAWTERLPAIGTKVVVVVEKVEGEER